MFNKIEFANIIKKIKNAYSSQGELSQKSGIGRTYLSQYMNIKLDNPPKPEILEKLANASNGITTYDELMYICGYTDCGFGSYSDVKELLKDTNITKDEWAYFWKDFYDLNLTYKESVALDKLEDQFYNITVNPKKLEKDELYKCYDKSLFNGYSQDEIDRIWKAFFIYADSFDFINGRKKDKNFPIPNRNYIIKNNDVNIDTSSPTDFKYYMCPIYGKIKAGIPNWAEECLEGYIPLDTNLMGIINPEECFFLRVDGESMNEVIQNGSYALIRKQSTAKTGDIVAAIVNGNNEATLKKFKRFNQQFVSFEPMSSDDSFEPINVDLKTTNVTILGVYIGKFEINKKS